MVQVHQILQLYLYLHEDSIPEDSERLRNTWDKILNDVNHHLISIEGILPALQHKGPVSQIISFLAAGKNFILAKTITADTVVS